MNFIIEQCDNINSISCSIYLVKTYSAIVLYINELIMMIYIYIYIYIYINIFFI